MRLRDRGAARQVGDAARHAQYPVVGACRPVQARHGAMQQLFAMWLQATMLFDFRAAQALVRFPLACQLQGKGCRYPRGDGLRAFAGACVPPQRRRWHGGDFDLQVDTVEQRAGQATAIAQHGVRRTAATAGSMPQVAARAGIHGGDQLKAGRKLGLAGRARNADDARFHGLAQDIEDPALEFGDFIGVYVRANVSRVSQNPVVKGFGVAAIVRVLARTWRCFTAFGLRLMSATTIW